jgi:hypothetical protein
MHPCYHSGVSHLRIPLLFTLVFLLSCYPEPSFPELPPPPSSSQDVSGTSASGAQPSSATDAPRQPTVGTVEEPPAQQQRRRDIESQLKRLGASAGIPRGKRPGAEDWRPLELEKLTEIVTSCCRASDVACRDCLAPLCEGSVAPDELWEIYGSFLGPLRDRAGAGVEVLGAHLLESPNGQTRDRALRVASASGVLPRGKEREGGARMVALPRAPRVGDSVLLILEKSALCNKVSGEVKGPDNAGRLDFDPRSDCPAPPEEATEQFVPKASRYVFTHRVSSLPPSGLEVWLANGTEPLLELRPPKSPSLENRSDSPRP